MQWNGRLGQRSETSAERSSVPAPFAVRFLIACSAVAATGCSTFWPRLVSPSPTDPVFHASFIAGGSSTDGALCSLATIGPDALRAVSPPEPTIGAIGPEQACSREVSDVAAQHGRVGQLIVLSTSTGPLYGYLYTAPSPSGLLVAFSGLGMPASGWINERFAEVGARKSFITFAPVRDEAARPIYFDPLREARRTLEAAKQLGQSCGLSTSAKIGFVGISLGGLEALLATREALAQGVATHASVLDPVLDAHLAIDNLDSYWHSFGVDSIHGFFQRILSGRYGEWPTPSFHDVMNRTRAHSDAMSDLDRDVPSTWLCGARRDAFTVFLSDEDPVLGEKQRDFARSCAFPLQPARAPGHVPLACRLELFDEVVDALGEQASGVHALTSRRPLKPRLNGEAADDN
jgi:hypothetical protein